MWRAVLVCAALACGVARAQPTLCQEDEQCSSGYYCEEHLCRECLSCEELKREPSRYANHCITSPSQCGDCLKGLAYDSETDRCVAELAGGAQAPSPASRPHLVWVAVVACLAVVAAFVAIVLVYLYRNPDTFKMTASARASVHHAPSSYAVSDTAAASAPPPPPPYSPQYLPAPEPYIEESSPLVKRGAAEGRGGAREAAGAQAAQVFNNPNYVHGPYYTHSPEVSPAASPEPFEPHDEDTMESLWRPASEPEPPASGSAVAAAAAAAAGSSAGAGAEAPGSDLEPAAKVPRLAQDSNNNKSAEARGGAGGTSVTLNFNLNVSSSAVQQLNNVAL